MSDTEKSAPHIETVYGPNPWQAETLTDAGLHSCYFCRPDQYPEMPKFHTLCARCGQLIFAPEYDSVMNEAMLVCEKCDREMTA